MFVYRIRVRYAIYQTEFFSVLRLVPLAEQASLSLTCYEIFNKHTIVPTNIDSDMFCLQLLNKIYLVHSI